MHEANLELSRELYELSRWDNTMFSYTKPDYKDKSGQSGTFICPKYDAGYLLRKLGDGTDLIYHEAESDAAHISGIRAKADTPEDALVQLAITLIKEGKL